MDIEPGQGIFGIIAGRYSDGHPNLDIFLKGHTGESYQVDRQGRDPVRIPAAHLTLGLAVQPDVIRSLAYTRELRGRGLLARFAYSLPTSLVGWRDLNPPAVPAAVRARYFIAVARLL